MCCFASLKTESGNRSKRFLVWISSTENLPAVASAIRLYASPGGGSASSEVIEFSFCTVGPKVFMDVNLAEIAAIVPSLHAVLINCS